MYVHAFMDGLFLLFILWYMLMKSCPDEWIQAIIVYANGVRLASEPQEVGVPTRADLGGSVPAHCETAARCTASLRDRDASNCNAPPSSHTAGLCLSRDRLTHTHTHIQMSCIDMSITNTELALLEGAHCLHAGASCDLNIAISNEGSTWGCHVRGKLLTVIIKADFLLPPGS